MNGKRVVCKLLLLAVGLLLLAESPAVSAPFDWPVPWDVSYGGGSKMKMWWNPQNHPTTNNYAFDFSIDARAGNEDPNVRIISPITGTLTKVVTGTTGFGNYVEITGDGEVVLMAHLRDFDANLPEQGRQIQRGTPIGMLGKSGVGPGILGANDVYHLHFELKTRPKSASIPIFVLTRDEFREGLPMSPLIGGNYNAVSGHFEDKQNQTTYGLASGQLSASAACVGDARDSIALNGSFNFTGGAWLVFGGRENTFQTNGVTWSTVLGDFIHHGVSFTSRVNTTVNVILLNNSVIELIVDHSYSRIVLKLEKSSARSSSASEFSINQTDSSDRRERFEASGASYIMQDQPVIGGSN